MRDHYGPRQAIINAVIIGDVVIVPHLNKAGWVLPGGVFVSSKSEAARAAKEAHVWLQRRGKKNV